MFCRNCGKQVADYSQHCPYCGHAVGNHMGGGVTGNGMQYGSMPGQRNKLDNIFSALMQERTPGVIMEFSLWCMVCVVAVLALVATILGNSKVVWIMLMLFAFGMGLMMAFRLKRVTMLCSIIFFQLIVSVIHFGSFAISYNTVPFSWLNVLLFVCGLLGAIGAIVCSSIHFFSRNDLGFVPVIIVISVSAVLILLEILLYGAPCIGTDASYGNDFLRMELNSRGYWLGTITLWIMYVTNSMFYVFYFKGIIDNSISGANTFHNSGFTGSATAPAIRCVQGNHAGQTFYLQGRTFTVGSQPGMNLVIQDPYVSRQHCAIRFNVGTGCYEIYDNSSNGVFLLNGGSLQKGVYHSVSSGSIICIGSVAQQFQLM